LREAALQRQTKSEVLRRLKSVEGHVRGVEKMVEEGDVTYADIVQQTNAIFSAIRRINTVLLKDFVEERAERDGASEEMINDLPKTGSEWCIVRNLWRIEGSSRTIWEVWRKRSPSSRSSPTLSTTYQKMSWSGP
jgi:DNA-binding FrmR family transcriptional regulator